MQERNIGHNSPYPCGSGKKYKHCCAAPVTIAEGYENRRINVTLLYGVREKA